METVIAILRVQNESLQRKITEMNNEQQQHYITVNNLIQTFETKLAELQQQHHQQQHQPSPQQYQPPTQQQYLPPTQQHFNHHNNINHHNNLWQFRLNYQLYSTTRVCK
jgi:hypothetical protein